MTQHAEHPTPRTEENNVNPKVRIVSNGTSGGTKVILAETGEEIGGLVSAVSWSLDCNSREPFAQVTLQIAGPLVDLDATGIQNRWVAFSVAELDAILDGINATNGDIHNDYALAREASAELDRRKETL